MTLNEAQFSKKPKRRKKDPDHCTSCGSENLYSGFFDKDDLAVVPDVHHPETDPGTRWTTFCNECGTEQK